MEFPCKHAVKFICQCCQNDDHSRPEAGIGIPDVMTKTKGTVRTSRKRLNPLESVKNLRTHWLGEGYWRCRGHRSRLILIFRLIRVNRHRRYFR